MGHLLLKNDYFAVIGRQTSAVAGDLSQKHENRNVCDRNVAAGDASSRHVANPVILINTLPLLEAQASSEIEQIVTTADRLFRFAGGGDAADPPTREALRYRHALLDGFAPLQSRPLCTATAELVCSRSKDAPMQVRRMPGTAVANDATAEIIYTHPDGEERILSLLGNWERFLHGEDSC